LAKQQDRGLTVRLSSSVRVPHASGALDQPRSRPLDVSVIIPILNEEANISPLLDEVFTTLRALGLRFEVIAINDGSRDGSLRVLLTEATRRPELQIIDFARNFGQTAALMAGIDHATGDVIIATDADLQNDPKDIPRLLEKLEEGYDVVSGWRRVRKDAMVRRRLVSGLANRLISWTTGVKLHDYGCTLKAYRRSFMRDVRLYGEMHRFIPIYASWVGARVAELEVNHRPREHGQSKYGLERVLKVALDLLVVSFLGRYLAKPIYVFGGFGALSIAISFLSFAFMIYLKIVEGVSMILTPLPVVVAMTFLVGMMSLLMGLLAEVLVRLYFEAQQRPPYVVRETFMADKTD
jgi:dolichol-phosphate mannosyltransferase